MTLTEFKKQTDLKPEIATIYYKLIIDCNIDLNTGLKIVNSNKIIFYIPFMKIFFIRYYNKLEKIVNKLNKLLKINKIK